MDNDYDHIAEAENECWAWSSLIDELQNRIQHGCEQLGDKNKEEY